MKPKYSVTRDAQDEAEDSVSLQFKSPSDGAGDETTESKSQETLEIPRWQSIFLTISLMLSLFCVSLDDTVLATAIPKITTQFHSLDDVGWYGSSYLFSTCAVQLQFGKIYSLFATKWVYLWSVFVFEAGSLLCAVAPNSVALIVGRSIAGLGSAGITLGSFVVMTRLVPLRYRPMYTSLLTSMHGIACVAGPLLGGVFTDYVTWRWGFYMNLSMGAIAIVCIVFSMPPLPPTQRLNFSKKQMLGQIDPIGKVILVPAVGETKYPWDNGRIIALFCVSAVLTAAFIIIQLWQKDRASIPLHIAKDHNILGALWFSVCLGCTLTVFTYDLPIWFQAVKGVSATKSGIMNLPMILGLVIVSLFAGALTSWIGYYTPLLMVSAIITPVGLGLLSTLEVDSGIGYWFGYQVLMVFGLGIGIQTVLLVSQVTVPLKDIPVATTLLLFGQTLAGAVFLPVCQSVFQNQLVSNLHEYAPDANSNDILEGGITGLRKVVSAEQLPSVLTAYNKALTQSFYVAVALSSLSILGPVWLDRVSLKSSQSVTDPSPQEASPLGLSAKIE
ncbi:MFS transporter [Penicillium pulvis]|uniref:MFS transporter n=1 Tax=Penicillium pulvis TaxID=1562058 RepID=UPI00254798E0|nr:MFS transporter [Penicillium pulvis]KAJ5798486.1 MFS transporter [Penicillium pulvis]